MDRSRLVGAVLSLPLEATPSLEGGKPSGCWQQHSPLGRGAPWPGLHGQAGPRRPPDTRPNVALPGPQVPGRGQRLQG